MIARKPRRDLYNDYGYILYYIINHINYIDRRDFCFHSEGDLVFYEFLFKPKIVAPVSFSRRRRRRRCVHYKSRNMFRV